MSHRAVVCSVFASLLPVCGSALLTTVRAEDVAAVAAASPARPPLHDEFLERLAGRWKLTRQVRGRTVENTVQADWVLDHQFLRVHMKDVAEPPAYEAEIFFGFDAARNRCVLHWLDSFGGRHSSVGYGVREGNTIAFLFDSPEGRIRNTFTFFQEIQTWASLVELHDAASGQWRTFATDHLQRP